MAGIPAPPTLAWCPSCAELPQVVIHVKIGVTHSLGPRQRTEHCMGCEFAFPATELIKQRAEPLDVPRKFCRSGAALLLIHFRASLDSVRPMKRQP